MVQWAKSHNALYRRYSDDFILIIPVKAGNDMVNTYENKIINILKKYQSYGLKVEQNKTEVRIFKNNRIYDSFWRESTLDYLGLVMDGEEVQLREQSLFKYYSRAYRKAKSCKKIEKKTGQKLGRRQLYKIYTHLGVNHKGYGNFISYAKKADAIMRDIGLSSKINNQIKRHWSKIQKRLKD